MAIVAEPLGASGFSGGSPSSSYAMTDSWANLVAAHTATPFALNTRLRCSDVGVNGSDWSVNSSGELFPVAPITLFTSTDSYARAPTGTIGTGASGNITLGTAAPRIYSEGVYLYLPNIATTPAITAGFYWCVMSSTTLGTLYASKGGAAINFSVGAGYTGVTTAIDFMSQAIPAGSMGSYRRINFTAETCMTNNGNSKIFYGLIGSTQFGSVNVASAAAQTVGGNVRNKGAAIQVLTSNISGGGGAGGAVSYATVNTAIDTTFGMRATGATATDWMGIDSATYVLFPR